MNSIPASSPCSPRDARAVLITNNGELVDNMLKNYPDLLTGDQVVRRPLFKPASYRFLDLDLGTLHRFLGEQPTSARRNYVIIEE